MKNFILCLGIMFLANCSTQSTNPIGIGTTPDFASLVPTSDYVIYYDNATLPTLYSAINMLTHTKPSYMYMGRASTIFTKKPSHVTMIEGSATEVDGTDNDDIATADAAMIAKIKELNTLNPQATFTFYVNESRFSRVFNYFYRQGISKDRVRVVQISDGTLTYNNWAENFSGTGAFSAWKGFEAKFNEEFNKENSTEPLSGEYFAHTGTQHTPAVLHTSYEYWMQWPELLVSDSEDLKNYLIENAKRYYKVDPLKYYQSLSSTDQQRFLTLLGLDKKWANGEGDGTLKDQTIGEALEAFPKPNIIITGTIKTAGNGTDDYIKRVKAHYGDKYDYFFKGHPGDTTHPSDKSIVVLPFRLPMEAIIWAYGNKMSVIGGFESTLYMNAPKEVDKFIFDRKSDGSDLVAPLNIMYKQGLLGKVEFFN